jgi:3'-phosphoadenosine 5'-phosphosulfate sulfotransferase (PAPS reductase)/FAD synthetase
MSGNPYKIDAPALVSFSGGRTSGFMLRQILDAHGGTLPEGMVVTFANTGKERSETLDFVHEVETRWAVPVTWLEYRYSDGSHGYAVVDYATASRAGEPFDALIAVKQFLPNPVMRFCTTELKVRVMKKHMQSLGHEAWDVVLGLRADEPRRVANARKSADRDRWTNVMPMAAAGHTLADVRGFWRTAPFDLKLEQHEGNCDLCFLKSAEKIAMILRERPDLAAWWIEKESGELVRAKSAANATFRSDRPRYANLLKIVQEQPVFEFGDGCLEECNCTD